jgi:Tol biopolymer transport system component
MNYFNYLKSFFVLGCSFCACSGMAQENKTVSKLEIYDIETGQRTVVKEFPYRIEAPNWTPDGKFLIYNSDGKLFKIEVNHPQSDEMILTGFATACNNDHVLATSGDRIAISHGTKEDGKSRIYILPITGGAPTLITPLAPSYLHGWSPDEKTLAYCAERNGNFDVYSIPAEGGIETRLTNSEGLDDGPEFAPCGKHIWFNSVRSGLMQIWRMNVDGSEQTQITFDQDKNSWFPHVSPDGEKVVYIADKKGDVTPSDHPPGKNVELRLMPASGGEAQTIVELFGGQGSLNVNSWSPDSKRFAFVSYNKIIDN